ncbi:MAG TPA: hypothetical protein VIN58_02310 [Roseateles sp.]
MALTVEQLMEHLATMPPQATVLLEGDGGLSPLGGLALLPGQHGLPDEVLLQPHMTPD